MRNKERTWSVLLIGGASGTGKSSIAYQLARLYEVNVLEIDDICQALKALTTADVLPALHYFQTGVCWKDIGVSGNVDWLIRMGKELAPAIRSIVIDHVEFNVPVIIEGDFMHPEIAASFDDPKVKTLFVHEPDREQIVQNYLAREPGERQEYRAEISATYSRWLAEQCLSLGIPVLNSRPWESSLDRAVDLL